MATPTDDLIDMSRPVSPQSSIQGLEMRPGLFNLPAVFAAQTPAAANAAITSPVSTGRTSERLGRSPGSARRRSARSDLNRGRRDDRSLVRWWLFSEVTSSGDRIPTPVEGLLVVVVVISFGFGQLFCEQQARALAPEFVLFPAYMNTLLTSIAACIISIARGELPGRFLCCRPGRCAGESAQGSTSAHYVVTLFWLHAMLVGAVTAGTMLLASVAAAKLDLHIEAGIMSLTTPVTLALYAFLCPCSCSRRKLCTSAQDLVGCVAGCVAEITMHNEDADEDEGDIDASGATASAPLLQNSDAGGAPPALQGSEFTGSSRATLPDGSTASKLDEVSGGPGNLPQVDSDTELKQARAHIPRLTRRHRWAAALGIAAALLCLFASIFSGLRAHEQGVLHQDAGPIVAAIVAATLAALMLLLQNLAYDVLPVQLERSTMSVGVLGNIASRVPVFAFVCAFHAIATVFTLLVGIPASTTGIMNNQVRSYDTAFNAQWDAMRCAVGLQPSLTTFPCGGDAVTRQGYSAGFALGAVVSNLLLASSVLTYGPIFAKVLTNAVFPFKWLLNAYFPALQATTSGGDANVNGGDSDDLHAGDWQLVLGVVLVALAFLYVAGSILLHGLTPSARWMHFAELNVSQVDIDALVPSRVDAQPLPPAALPQQAESDTAARGAPCAVATPGQLTARVQQAVAREHGGASVGLEQMRVAVAVVPCLADNDVARRVPFNVDASQSYYKALREHAENLNQQLKDVQHWEVQAHAAKHSELGAGRHSTVYTATLVPEALRRVLQRGAQVGSFASMLRTLCVPTIPLAFKSFKRRTAAAHDAFSMEVALMSNLKHPNIIPYVACVDLWNDLERRNDPKGGALFEVIMLSVPHTLEKLFFSATEVPAIILGGAVTTTHKLQMLLQIAAALECMHSGRCTLNEPWIHGDVKPENVLVSIVRDAHSRVRRVCAYLADFSASVPMRPDRRIPAFGWPREENEGALLRDGEEAVHAGSVCYSPPELLPASAPANMTTGMDVYAFGCLALALMCGEHPFSDEAHWQLEDTRRNVPPRHGGHTAAEVIAHFYRENDTNTPLQSMSPSAQDQLQRTMPIGSRYGNAFHALLEGCWRRRWLLVERAGEAAGAAPRPLRFTMTEVVAELQKVVRLIKQDNEDI